MKKNIIITIMITFITSFITTLIITAITHPEGYKIAQGLEYIAPNTTPIYKTKKPVNIEDYASYQLLKSVPELYEFDWYGDDLNYARAYAIYPHFKRKTVILNTNTEIKNFDPIIIHEYAHYLLETHPKRPKSYIKLSMSHKEIMTDLLAYQIYPIFTNKDYYGSYVQDPTLKTYEEYNLELIPLITAIKEKHEAYIKACINLEK